jgi:molybdopterin-guanine dinucleotide biosynthesis protein A
LKYSVVKPLTCAIFAIPRRYATLFLRNAVPEGKMTRPAKPVGVLLAGGLGTRMGGGDKPLRLLAGRPLLARTQSRIAPQVAALAINANGNPARYAPFGLPILPDTIPDFPGPLAGILAAMRWAAGQGAHEVLTMPADTPFPPDDLVVRLQSARLQSARTTIACASSAGRTHPAVALWPVALADILETALLSGTRKVIAWAEAQGLTIVDFPAEPIDPFFNINRPEDLIAAEHLLIP